MGDGRSESRLVGKPATWGMPLPYCKYWNKDTLKKPTKLTMALWSGMFGLLYFGASTVPHPKRSCSISKKEIAPQMVPCCFM